MINNNKKVRKKGLKALIDIEKKLIYADEKYLFIEYIISAISKSLDLSELEKNSLSVLERFRKDINKYTSEYKNEKYIENILKEQEKLVNLISIKYFKSVSEIMNIFDKILNNEIYYNLFKENLPEVEDYYQFDIEDMVFVNGILKYLKNYNSQDINIDIIFYAINKAIKEYVQSIENNIDYLEYFDNADHFVSILKKEVKLNE